MTRFALLAGLLMASAGAVPAHSKKVDKRLEAAIACTNVKEPGLRLACYDAAVATLQEAVRTGTIATDGVGHPTSLEGIAVAAGGRGYDRAWVRLDNGDRWEVVIRNFDDMPRTGKKVRITKSPLGNYFYNEPGRAARRANFLGHSVKE